MLNKEFRTYGVRLSIQLYPLFLFFKPQSTFSLIFFISFSSFLEWVVCGMANQESRVNKKSRFTRKTYSNHASRKKYGGPSSKNVKTLTLPL